MSALPGTSTNPFEVLGLDRTASFDDVKLAYRRLAREYHPDANPNDPTALERFTALRRAYDRLKIFFQTLDDAGTVAANGGGSVSTRPPLTITRAQNGSAAVSIGDVIASRQAQRSAGASAEPVPWPGGTGSRGLEHDAESVAPAMNNRRAFRRTGPMRQPGEIEHPTGNVVRQSGDIALRTGDIARQSGEIARGLGSPDLPGDTPPTPDRGVRPAGTRLPAPQQIGGGHLAMRADIVYGHATIAAGDDPRMFYALVGLRASDGVVFPRVPLNLCLVLDHSSSMLRGGKVDRLKETVRLIIDQLEDDDYLAIVSFGDRAEVLLPAQPLNNKASVQGAIDAMRCRGGTEMSRGLAAGLSELSRNASRGLSHLILLTDGQTSGDEMICLERAEEAAGANVCVTAYGLGADWNSALMDGIAGPTGGHSDYIEAPDAMASALTTRVAGLQSTTLRKVVLAVHPAPGAALHRASLVSPILRPLDGLAGRADAVSLLGDMSGNTDYRLLLELTVTPSAPGPLAVADLALRYDVPGLQRDGELLTIPLATHVSSAHDPHAHVDPRVTDALRAVTVHRLQQQAWSAISGGNVAKGTGLLKRAAEHLKQSGHAELAEVAALEAARLESGDQAHDDNIKRIIYGTRRLG